jgi:hypothetical protein
MIMAVVLGLLVWFLAMSVYLVFGGLCINCAINNFIKGKYFVGGVEAMCALAQVAWMLKTIIKW